MTQTYGMDVDAIRAAVTGTVALPGEPGYAEACSIWNGAIGRRPAVVARCRTAADVSAALGFARERGLEISVRGGGHGFAGFALCDGGLMVDLSPMRSVQVDAGAGRAVCGGGASWADVDGATQAHGLAVPGGFVSHTGIAGLTLGGGIGWLTRLAGLTCDNLVGAEVVTAAGDLLGTSESENEDLFWALRGGGGNFGVVTSFEYRLRPAGPLVHLGLMFWGVDRGAEALRLARDLARDLPDELSPFLAALNAPPEPFVPEEHHLAPGYALLVVGFGDEGEHTRVMAAAREALPPLFELVTPIPYAHLQQMFDASAPWGAFGYEKALHLEDLDDAAIEVITEHWPRRSSPLSFVPIFPLGGAFARVAEDATAFGGSRRTRFVVNITAVTASPEAFAAEREWVRSFWSDLAPHAEGLGGYVNFMSDPDEDRVRAAYGSGKYERLAAVKARYDPANVFHLNANILPAGQLV